jgi:hypothetical protein
LNHGFNLTGRYSDGMHPARTNEPDTLAEASLRDAQEVPDAVLESRRRPMAQRLELALSWNLVASELKTGMSKVKKNEVPGT